MAISRPMIRGNGIVSVRALPPPSLEGLRMLPHSPLSASVHLPHLQDQLPLPTLETLALFIPGPIHTAAHPTPQPYKAFLTLAPSQAYSPLCPQSC